MGGKGILILTDTSTLDVEARETEHLLLKYGVVAVRQLTHKHLLRETTIARILIAILDFCHTMVELLTGDIQGSTELQGIQMVLCLVHHYHDIVCRLVINEQFTFTVVDNATRRIFNLLEEGIGVGILLVVVAHNLEGKEANDIDDNDTNSHSADYIAPIIDIIVVHCCRLVTLSNVNISTKVIAVLPITHLSHSPKSKKLNDSSVKNTTQ